MSSNELLAPDVCDVCCVSFNKTYRTPTVYALIYHPEEKKCFMCTKCEKFFTKSARCNKIGFFKEDHMFSKFYSVWRHSYFEELLCKFSSKPCDKTIDYNNFYTAIYVKNIYENHFPEQYIVHDISHKYILKQKFNHFSVEFYLPTTRIEFFYTYYIIREKEVKGTKVDEEKIGTGWDLEEILLQFNETETKSIKRKFFGQNSYIKSQSRNYVDLTKMTDNCDFIKFFIDCVLDISKLGDIDSICHYNILEYLEFLDCLMEFDMLKKSILVILDIENFDKVLIVPKRKMYSDFLTDFIILASFRRVEQLDNFVVNKKKIFINGIVTTDLFHLDNELEIYLLNYLISSELPNFVQGMNLFTDMIQGKEINLQINQDNILGNKIFTILNSKDQHEKTEKLIDIINNHCHVLKPGLFTIDSFYKIIHDNKNRYKIFRAFITKFLSAETLCDTRLCSFSEKDTKFFSLFESMLCKKEFGINIPFIKELKFYDSLNLFFEN